MNWLPDSTLVHLRKVVDAPDFSATKYELLEKIGEGGMASVYVAHDRDLDRQVAVKVIHGVVDDPAIRERMVMEARTIARLEHPGILPIHDIGFLPDGRIYYAMKLVRGRRLDASISEITTVPDRLRLFLRVCDAIAFAHSQGVIHRDLKPSNVMVGDFGDVLVIDWGLAKSIGESTELESFGAVLGTPGYMAPEQEKGDLAAIDQRTDVFALGMMLAAVLPDRSSKPLQAIVDKASARRPDDRYESVVELGRDISRFLDGERVTAFPESLWVTTRRLAVRHKTVIILIATYLVVRVILLFLSSR